MGLLCSKANDKETNIKRSQYSTWTTLPNKNSNCEGLVGPIGAVGSDVLFYSPHNKSVVKHNITSNGWANVLTISSELYPSFSYMKYAQILFDECTEVMYFFHVKKDDGECTMTSVDCKRLNVISKKINHQVGRKYFLFDNYFAAMMRGKCYMAEHYLGANKPNIIFDTKTQHSQLVDPEVDRDYRLRSTFRRSKYACLPWRNRLVNFTNCLRYISILDFNSDTPNKWSDHRLRQRDCWIRFDSLSCFTFVVSRNERYIIILGGVLSFVDTHRHTVKRENSDSIYLIDINRFEITKSKKRCPCKGRVCALKVAETADPLLICGFMRCNTKNTIFVRVIADQITEYCSVASEDVLYITDTFQNTSITWKANISGILHGV